MKAIARSLVVILIALIAVPALAVSVTLTTAVQLLATTALIMGGTQHPLSIPPDTNQFITDYMNLADQQLHRPDASPASHPTEQPGTRGLPRASSLLLVLPLTTTFDDSVAVGRNNLDIALERLWAGTCNGGVDRSAASPTEDTFIVFGYSQSAVVASLVKRTSLTTQAMPPDGHRISTGLESHAAQRRHPGARVRGLTIPIHRHHLLRANANSCSGRVSIPTMTS